MVTLCYLRRYADFCLNLLLEARDAKAQVSLEVIEWFDRVANECDSRTG